MKIVARFYTVQYKHMKQDVTACAFVIVPNFSGVYFCRELAKLDNIWLSYRKYKKGDVFSETQCMLNYDDVVKFGEQLITTTSSVLVFIVRTNVSDDDKRLLDKKYISKNYMPLSLAKSGILSVTHSYDNVLRNLFYVLINVYRYL